jgi:protein-tyrosine phosphatase
VIDIHTHLLPAVDDGSPSVEVSLRVLERLRLDGVTQVVCTPHLEASFVHRRPLDLHRARLAELQAASDAIPELLLGCELMLDAPGQRVEDPSLGLGESRALLVEFSRMGVPPQGGAELRRLRSIGWTPVLAHPERYRGCTLDDVRDWRDFGVVIQTDAKLLLSTGPAADLAIGMLEAGLIDIIASDNHGDHRSQRAVVDWLSQLGADAQASVLTTENPGRLLRGESLIPVPAVPRPRGVLDRLGRLFGRR